MIAGVFALLTLERAVSEWVALHDLYVHRAAELDHRHHAPIALAALLTVSLLAASPSFIFWSRQGIFVTNVTQPLVYFCIWQGIRWLRCGSTSALVLSALAGGLALYAKLLAGWLVVPFALLAGGWWVVNRLRTDRPIPKLTWKTFLAATVAFVIPLTPLVLFNLQTGGTLSAITDNLDRSYYGVADRNLAVNIPIRLQQIVQSIDGAHFWYLGGIYGNQIAPWLALLATVAGVWRSPRLLLAPLLMLGLAILFSLYTISDLFITHYALLQPVLIAIAGLGLSTWTTVKLPRFAAAGRTLVVVLMVLWLALDLTATFSYHRALSRSGGLADHSDASYQVAYYLRSNGLGAPIALDWGFDAPVRFLSTGDVRPIEIFGYESPREPDPDFTARLATFIENPDNVYLLHSQDFTVFAGRREVFMIQVASAGKETELEAIFRQRDGTALYELWRVRTQSNE